LADYTIDMHESEFSEATRFGAVCRPRLRRARALARRLGELIAEETEKWGNVIRALNIKAE
jgi:hypothetical protein